MATAEARELSLLDRVELKLALADSEAKLQNILNIYLTPLLLKLASEHVTVRNKVSDITVKRLIVRHSNSHVDCLQARIFEKTNVRMRTVAAVSAFMTRWDLLASTFSCYVKTIAVKVSSLYFHFHCVSDILPIHC